MALVWFACKIAHSKQDVGNKVHGDIHGAYDSRQKECHFPGGEVGTGIGGTIRRGTRLRGILKSRLPQLVCQEPFRGLEDVSHLC